MSRKQPISKQSVKGSAQTPNHGKNKSQELFASIINQPADREREKIFMRGESLGKEIILKPSHT